MKSILTLRLVTCALLAVLLGGCAIGAVFAWHEVGTLRSAQRSFLLTQAFAGVAELRGFLKDEKINSLPPQVPGAVEQRIRRRLSNDESTENPLAALGSVIEVLRHEDPTPERKARFVRVSFFTTPSKVPTELASAPSRTTNDPSNGLIWACEPCAVSQPSADFALN
ncbi:MAG TPA: hypothetical protein VGH65_11265, partial [Verrucomicrobiaceae bacterium]